MNKIYPPDITEFTQYLNSYLAEEEIAQVTKAYNYAALAHKDQQRRSGEPYITHPLAVAKILAELKMDHECLMAALLHDVIEDTIITADNLRHEFGETVTSLVNGVTKLTYIDFQTKAEAQAENFQKMALAMARDIRVILIKLADRLHNMRTLGSLPAYKAKRIAQETLEIFAPIANRLGLHGMYLEFEDLGFNIMYPVRAKRLQSAVNAIRKNHQYIIMAVTNTLITELEKFGLQVKVSGREKHLYSIYRKMRAKHQSFQQIMDVYAIRVVVDSIDNCYRTLGVVHSLYTPVPGKFKDYIAIPKANGYQSLHTTLFSAQEVHIEVQIRTQEMDIMANNGITSHWSYKSSLPPQERDFRAKNWVIRVLELQKRAGNSLEFIESIKNDLFPDAVYVFTPLGKIIELPKEATAVDFAYMIHSDIGNSCVACRINRNLAPLSQQLRNGEMVEIITAPDAKPKDSWLSFAVTARARAHISHAVEQQKSANAIILGKRLLNIELSKFNTDLEQINPLFIAKVLKQHHFKKLNELLENIGKSKILAHTVASNLCDQPYENKKIEPLLIQGTEGLTLIFADCCHPIPGDLIGGERLENQGIMVHLEDCSNLAHIRQKQESYIPLSWVKDISGEFKSELKIELATTRGCVAQVSNIINEENANIEYIKQEHIDSGITIISTLIIVTNRMHLVRIFKKLRMIRNIIKITRVKH